MRKISIFLFISIVGNFATANDVQSLKMVLDKALEKNLVIQSESEDYRAERELVTSKYSLADPAIGLNNLNRGNQTEYLTIQQKIRFPTKYFLEGKAQKRKSQASKNKYIYTKFKLRENVVNLYFEIFSIQKIIELTKTNLQIVKDFARIAEKKYAADKSTQSDSMKAHFEITQLEIDLLRFEQVEVRLQETMKAYLSDSNAKSLDLLSSNLTKPVVNFKKLNKLSEKIDSSIKESSPALKAQEKMMQAAQYKRSLAKWEFAPDFNVQYQERISGLPEDSKIISFNASIPLWFWRNSSEASFASARANAEESRYKDMTFKLAAQFKAVKTRIINNNKTLKIYKTTLVPQAEGAYRSTREAYKSGKTSFLDLLDSERSLYQVKEAYYRTLANFVKDVSLMESVLGKSISNLYGIEGVIL